MESPTTFATCITLNNRGVDAFTKDHNLEEASLLFSTALRNLSKRANQIKSSRKTSRKRSEQARQIMMNEVSRKGQKKTINTEQPSLQTTPYTTEDDVDEQQRNVTDDEAEQEKQTSIHAAVPRENTAPPKRKNNAPTASKIQCKQSHHQELKGRRNGDPRNLHVSQLKLDSSTSKASSASSPIRLSLLSRSATAGSGNDTLRQVSLSTVVVCFNLALTHDRMGFLVRAVCSNSKNVVEEQEKKNFDSAFTLYELACSMRLFLHGRGDKPRGSNLALLDRLLVQNAKELYAQLDIEPKETSSFRKLSAFVDRLETDQLRKLYQRQPFQAAASLPSC